MKQRYVLAFDLGTSGVKGVIVTLDGSVVATASASYPYQIPAQGWGEQNPEDYWRGVCAVTGEVVAKSGISPEDIAGMAFGTLWKGIIPIDGEGNVLRSSILWLDSRAADQAKRLNAHFGKELFSPSDYWPKLMWLRENEPETVRKAVMILEVNSFLKWKATGKASMDISNCFVRSFDPELDAFYAEVLEFMDFPREKFPQFANAYDMVGNLTEEAAAQMGLVPGIPVFGGNTDIQGVAVGSGCSSVNSVHMYLGSSGWTGFTVPHSPMSRVSHIDREREVWMASIRAVGLSLNWFANAFYTAECQQLGGDVFQAIDRDVERVPAGAEGVLATPWFYNGRTDVGGCFLNLRPNHDRRYMARAIMEGICYQLKICAESMCRNKGFFWPKEINAVGGGACSDVWMQMLADIFDVTILVPEVPQHAGAVGTAYCALIGLGICTDYDDAAKKVRIQRVFTPREETKEIYATGYSLYRQLNAALKPVFSNLTK